MTNNTLNQLTSEQYELLNLLQANGPATHNRVAGYLGRGRDEVVQDLLTLSHLNLASYDWDAHTWDA